jgi:hypothetical protein
MTAAAGGPPPDQFYERKVVEGRITPSWDSMSGPEMDAVLNGRYRGDGRRIDQYIVDDPMMITLTDHTR